eukprot:6207090-Pleurochrysis_carterae.AAC.4
MDIGISHFLEAERLNSRKANIRCTRCSLKLCLRPFSCTSPEKLVMHSDHGRRLIWYRPPKQSSCETMDRCRPTVIHSRRQARKLHQGSLINRQGSHITIATRRQEA